MSSESVASFFAKIKDSLQMIMYITAITGTTLVGVIKGCGLMNDDEEGKQEVVVKQPVVEETKIEPGPKPGEKPKEAVGHKDNSAAVKSEPKPVQEPLMEVKKKPAPAKNEPVKKVPGTVQNGKSGLKAKPVPEPAKPAEPAFKQMTEEEREKFAEEKKEEMKKTGEELEKRQEEKDPEGKSSNVKKEEKKKINKDEDDFRKKMQQKFKKQKDEPVEE